MPLLMEKLLGLKNNIFKPIFSCQKIYKRFSFISFMKKVMLFLLVGIFLISFVVAQGQGEGQGDGTGTQNIDAINQQTQDQNRVQVQDGTHVGEGGQELKIQTQANNRIKLEVGGVSAECDCEMKQEKVQDKTELYAELSNGKNVEIKIMPDTASEKALERLRLKVCSEENNCTIELKEVGQGNKTKLAYEVKARKKAKMLGLFKIRMRVESQVDAETGEIIRTARPWWFFLTTETEE